MLAAVTAFAGTQVEPEQALKRPKDQERYFQHQVVKVTDNVYMDHHCGMQIPEGTWSKNMTKTIQKVLFKPGLNHEFEILDIGAVFKAKKEMMSTPHRAQF